ncbi:MAG: hypothetical protein J3K34DRAFT_459100 [Monoraphidium minutum]|nr:MAG: hypothetical protein J3K34DRAFT_459100 [Monoraphidium minutum]
MACGKRLGVASLLAFLGRGPMGMRTAVAAACAGAAQAARAEYCNVAAADLNDIKTADDVVALLASETSSHFGAMAPYFGQASGQVGAMRTGGTPADCTFADMVSLCNTDANVRAIYQACEGALPRTTIQSTATVCGVPAADFSDLAGTSPVIDQLASDITEHLKAAAGFFDQATTSISVLCPNGGGCTQPAACDYSDVTALCDSDPYFIDIVASCSAAADTSGDPHMTGFSGHKYSFCEEGNGAACLGRTFSVFSSPQHALNTRITRMAGPDAWPHAGAWMTAYGFRYADVLTLELELATDVDYTVVPDGRGPDTTRAVVPADWRGVFAGLRDAAARIGSGETLKVGAAGEASVHFPSRRHAGDATDGPVVVIKTPGLQVKAYLESEDVTHLDFQITLIGATIAEDDAHGLLGQSLGWAPAAPAAVEGGEMDYVVEGAGGLLATAFKYSRFEGAAAGRSPTAVRRMLINNAAAGGAPRRGGSRVL